jgi:hypothetical protein
MCGGVGFVQKLDIVQDNQRWQTNLIVKSSKKS